MEADIQHLYSSSICSVHNFLCRCQSCSTSNKEHEEQFVVAYIRKGNFQFNAFRNELDAYHGLFLINKPHYEYRVKHVHNLPDECTIFSISESVLDNLKGQAGQFDWFFKDPDKHSALIRATPATEYLHHCVLNLLQTPNTPRLWVEALMTELLMQVLSSGMDSALIPALTAKQKKNYMPIIERVKLFMNENFMEDISLSQLADIGNMSVFHFNRLFKKLTDCTPYKYLLNVRLQLAHLNLKNTSLPVTEVAFASGFKSLDHFSATYKDHFGKSPSAERF
ncbi:MAG TPA: AraC family transcriptional regulator [Chryseolinea sp.]|nr:AraC family transcriptional regulator [Chryseolinea sp.]